MTKKLSCVVLLVAACASEEAPISWDEFQERAHYEPDTGLWVMNGDEPVRSLDELRAMYARYVEQHEGYGSTEQHSIVHQVNGQDSVWPPSQAINLTYCIKKAGFLLPNGGFNAERYALVVAAMNGATADWEGVGRINFVHASQYDGTGCTNTSPVVFNIRQVNSLGQYVASAFFPDYPRAQREVKIDITAFGDLSPWTLRGILRHELGHTLGFRHEHTRPEAGTCFEDNNWRALTPYDSASVMHYPHCNGTQTGDLVITAQDAQGAATLYPF